PRRAERGFALATAGAVGLWLRAVARVRARLDGPSVRDRNGRYHALPDRGRGSSATAPTRPRRRAVNRPGRPGRQFRHRRSLVGPRFPGPKSGPMGSGPRARGRLPGAVGAREPRAGPVQPDPGLPDGRRARPEGAPERPDGTGPGDVDRRRDRAIPGRVV